MFGFVAKHPAVWPVSWMCDAFSVSRSGLHAWPTRPRSARAIQDERLGAAVRASFVRSDRTYGARRVWHDVLAESWRRGRPKDLLHHWIRVANIPMSRSRGCGRTMASHAPLSAVCCAIACRAKDEPVAQCLGQRCSGKLLLIAQNRTCAAQNLPDP